MEDKILLFFHDTLPGILGIILTFGIAILVHEFGHFLFAKLSGVGVETFCIGFGKKIIKIKYGETDYALAWIPFGGYVQLKGAVSKEMENYINEQTENVAPPDSLQPPEPNESAEDNTNEQKPSITAQPQKKKLSLTDMIAEDTSALRDKSVFVKCGVFASGVFFNYLTAVTVLTLLFTIGFQRESDFKPVLGQIPADSYIKNYDVQEGDKIIAVENEPVETWTDAVMLLYDHTLKFDNPLANVTLLRNGEKYPTMLPTYADDKYTSTPKTASEMSSKSNSEDAETTITLSKISERIPSIIGNVKENSPAKKSGLQPFDRILEVDGEPVKFWDQATDIIARNNGSEIELKVKRQSETHIIKIPKREDTKNGIGIASRFLFDLRPQRLPYISFIVFNKAAERAGLEKGDLIMAINNIEMKNWEDVTDIIKKNANKEITFKIKRKDKVFETVVTPKGQAKDPSVGEIGIILGNNEKELIKKPLFEAFVGSVSSSVDYLKLIIKTTVEVFGTMNISIIRENVGGPIAIGIMSYKIAQRELTDYFFFLVIFNLMLFIMNLLPIPVMDGGHIFFTIIESITKKPIPPKLLMRINFVFVFLLISLAILVTFNDIITNIWRIGFGK